MSINHMDYHPISEKQALAMETIGFPESFYKGMTVGEARLYLSISVDVAKNGVDKDDNSNGYL